ncbi:MAG: hypothetical protein HYT77_06455 [Deltaproteobacteria bacterium]|nr:hypothetical protein [Deltaproteobacteria bacterium]
MSPSIKTVIATLSSLTATGCAAIWQESRGSDQDPKITIRDYLRSDERGRAVRTIRGSLLYQWADSIEVNLSRSYLPFLGCDTFIHDSTHRGFSNCDNGPIEIQVTATKDGKSFYKERIFYTSVFFVKDLQQVIGELEGEVLRKK